MKEKITSLVLVLVVAMSMTVGASAASYIPDDVTYQNLNGQQLAIKTYTLLPDQDPADLYEEDFEHDGFLYSRSGNSVWSVFTLRFICRISMNCLSLVASGSSTQGVMRIAPVKSVFVPIPYLPAVLEYLSRTALS